ncbi:CHAT domain-containing protein [Streptomyces sp. NPDC048751]|uniref:CHAT domain-containing tetratricopeptide repeat protein n=1 Tax=Streptomyces sp. NPDC048751 TaxID=3365591 RepID=UPI00371CC5BA
MRLVSLCVHSHSGERAQWLAAVQARLRRINAGDHGAALELQSWSEARRLAPFLADGLDLEVGQALGWLHWYRYAALPEGEGDADLDTAIELFTPSFLNGVDALPAALLPILRDAIVPSADHALLQAMSSAEPAWLSAAVNLWQRILATTPADDPGRAGTLANLGIALQTRYERVGDGADLDEAVRVSRDAVQTASTRDPGREKILGNLGNALRLRFERTADPADLNEAVEALQEVVRATPPDAPNRAGRLNNLSIALRLRGERNGDRADADAAVDAGWEAVRLAPAGSPHRALFQSSLGNALLARFKHTDGPADLDAAISVGREAVQGTPSSSPNRAGRLNHLANALHARFKHTGNLADLDAAIGVRRDVVQVASADSPQWAGYLAHLGSGLQTQFDFLGDPADLDEAISLIRDAVQTAKPGYRDRENFLNNLGNALRTRFERTGDQADLDEAINFGRQAVQATPADNPRDRAWHLNHLSGRLQARFERTGDQADLDEAIALGREAVRVTPADSPDLAWHLNNVGAALHRRSQRTEDRADLDEAIRVGRDAIRATPTDDPLRAGYLSNLALALRGRYERNGDRSDLDEAIRVGRDVDRATPTGSPNRAMFLSNLGIALLSRFDHTPEEGDTADLNAAVDALQEAVDVTPSGHSDRGYYLNNLGSALQRRFRQSADPADLRHAASVHATACESSSAPPSARISGAQEAARLLATSQVRRAVDLLETAVRLLPEVASRRLGRDDQQFALGRFAGLAGDAAALALADTRGTRAERATRALRLLEGGRAILLSQAMDTRSDLTDLRQAAPELATRFVDLREQLDQPVDTFARAPERSDHSKTQPRVQNDRREPDRQRLALDFAATLNEIRTRDGFASFGLPPTTAALLAQADQGPVVVFNTSRHGSHALLLTASGIDALSLPELGRDTLIDQVNTFHQALHTAASGKDESERREAQATLTQILEWLWDAATGPVLSALGHHGVPAPETTWPRVWWAPGGLLGLLPVHAAGYHTDPADAPERRTVLDRVVSSYTPTVRALRHARQRPPAPAAPSRALVVAMPTTPHLRKNGRLHYVGAEVARLRHHASELVLLLEPDPPHDESVDASPQTPTRDNVLAHLPSCPIAHFACHGRSHPTDPSKSTLLLHDHKDAPLTVASLSPVLLDQAQLAYLSACRTAAIDTADLVDEAIHLTSAFQLAGYPHVIGTLWEINDGIAVVVADMFYTHLRTGPHTLDSRRSALALHKAVRAIRDIRRGNPSLWAAYLHAGA